MHFKMNIKLKVINETKTINLSNYVCNFDQRSGEIREEEFMNTLRKGKIKFMKNNERNVQINFEEN